MSETVAVALITGGLVAFSGVAGQGIAWWLERGRRTHDRDMRLLEWRRQDRLERLAPVGKLLDAISREAVNLGVAAQGVASATAAGKGPDEVAAMQREVVQRSSRLRSILEKQGQVMWRSSDEELNTPLLAILECIVQTLVQSDRSSDMARDLAAWVRKAWDRLDELQSAL